MPISLASPLNYLQIWGRQANDVKMVTLCFYISVCMLFLLLGRKWKSFSGLFPYPRICFRAVSIQAGRQLGCHWKVQISPLPVLARNEILEGEKPCFSLFPTATFFPAFQPSIPCHTIYPTIPEWITPCLWETVPFPKTTNGQER